MRCEKAIMPISKCAVVERVNHKMERKRKALLKLVRSQPGRWVSKFGFLDPQCA